MIHQSPKKKKSLKKKRKRLKKFHKNKWQRIQHQLRILPIIKVITIAAGIVSQLNSVFDAASEGRWDLVVARSIQLFAQVVSTGQSCFTGDTLVATKEGQKPIEEIEVGDEVWSYNVETGEAKLNKVVKVFIYETDVLVHLHTESAIIDTKTHPFYVEGRGFVAAVDLQEGDKII